MLLRSIFHFPFSIFHFSSGDRDPRRRQTSPLETSPLHVVITIAAVLSVLSFLYFFANGMTNVYGDGVAHVNIARKMDGYPEGADLLRSVLPVAAADDEDASTSLFRLNGEQVMQRLSKPVLPARPTSGGGGAARLGDPASPGGGAAGLGRFFSGIKSAARNLMNFATYYQMKERAGTVGREGLSPLMRDIRTPRPDLKLHLIGHSFGGRLVTAAAAGRDDQPVVKPDTLVLLQAAFSHHGFAQRFDGTRDGFFRQVVANQMIEGPVIITCTRNDRAVGLAYPLASLIAGQVAAGLGDKNDLYGGMGRNGAQKTPEANDGTLLAVGGTYAFQTGALYNLNADQIIHDHSDICKDEVAHALLTAVAAT